MYIVILANFYDEQKIVCSPLNFTNAIYRMAKLSELILMVLTFVTYSA